MNKNIYTNQFNSYNITNIETFLDKENWNEKDKLLDEETKNLCHIEAIEHYILNLNYFCRNTKKPKNINIID